jgi:hypothetical protein
MIMSHTTLKWDFKYSCMREFFLCSFTYSLEKNGVMQSRHKYIMRISQLSPEFHSLFVNFKLARDSLYHSVSKTSCCCIIISETLL